MYLPQLTSGPSSLAWSPDSRELIYSMAGSLWRQKSAGDAGTAAGRRRGAQQLTAASYDYQPDWSPDGRWVVYSSYRNDAVELWLLGFEHGTAKPLLANGAVNVEPRFSPDGSASCSSRRRTTGAFTFSRPTSTTARSPTSNG